ncbi:alkaline phosphatase [Aquirufa sp.]|jgi:alkaline phosphatase|uniref:alkaline phosphatase n=1 Tax=Aquirufa sp. TaxID=2676249 RepID=UPI0037BF95C4
MKKLLLLLMISSTVWGQNLLTKAHAHNDYEHERPFYEAFSLGFGSIEVDVYAINGELLVAHDIKDIKASRTFQNLYLEPLVNVLEAGKAGNYHQLLIDSKTSADSTMPLLLKAIEPFKDLILKNKFRIVISGNRPAVSDYVKFPNWITFDGRPNEEVPSFLASHVVLESEAFYKFGFWNGTSPMTPALRDKLKTYVDKVHAAGRVVRLWATPEGILTYQTLLDLGVDYIGTDQLGALAAYLKASR